MIPAGNRCFAFGLKVRRGKRGRNPVSWVRWKLKNDQLRDWNREKYNKKILTGRIARRKRNKKHRRTFIKNILPAIVIHCGRIFFFLSIFIFWGGGLT